MKTKKLELYFINSRQGLGLRQVKEESIVIDIITLTLATITGLLFLAII